MAMNNGTENSNEDRIGSVPDVDVDTAGRGSYQLEGEPGIHVVKSIGQDDWLDYSNNSTAPKYGNG